MIKNPEMIRFVSVHLKTTRRCKHELKMLPFVVRIVPDQYKTQQMCDKAVAENVEHCF